MTTPHHAPQTHRHPFAELGIGPRLTSLLPTEWEAPFPIQRDVIPLIIKGHDVIGLAETGSGKTAAFALPIIQGMLASPGERVRALVLNPVRELAAQTHQVFRELSQGLPIETALFRGGFAPTQDQFYLSSFSPQIVVGTPGRLAHLIRMGDLDVSGVDTFVIDEADCMAKEFDSADFNTIVRALPRTRQNLLFSATLPESIAHRMYEISNRPALVSLRANRPPASIQFEEYDVESNLDKLPLFTTLMRERNFDRGLVFMNRKKEIDAVETLLVKMGFNARALHHNRSQGYCEDTLEAFKQGKIDFLVASDALQRGIDVSGLPLVVNYDLPVSYEDFTHRAGRTGRQGRDGLVLSFLTYRNRMNLRASTGAYEGYLDNLKANCAIETRQSPPITTVLSNADRQFLSDAIESAWKRK